MCCLTNEEETYEELNSHLPAIRQLVKVVVTLDDDEKEIREYKVEELRFKPRKKKNAVKLTKEEMRELSELEKE